MSKLLENVARARIRRAEAEQAFRDALRRARPRHTLAELAGAAGMSRNGVYWHLTREAKSDGDGS